MVVERLTERLNNWNNYDHRHWGSLGRRGECGLYRAPVGGNGNRERCGGRVSGEVELFDRVGFTLTGGGFDGGGGETIRALVGVIIHQIVVAVARFCGFDGGLGRLEIRMLTGSERGFCIGYC